MNQGEPAFRVWAVIGWLFILAVTINVTKSCMIGAAAGGGGEPSGTWLRLSLRRTLKSAPLCVCVSTRVSSCSGSPLSAVEITLGG